MTAVRLGSAQAPRHAVVGSCNGDAVYHVGLLSEDALLTAPHESTVHHMGPPLELPGTIATHVAGWLDDLSDDERIALDDWIAEMRRLVATGFLQGYGAYIAMPSVEYDLATGRTVTRRLSCAGFVAEGYRAGIGVQLVVVDALLPPIDRALLERVWSPRHVRIGSRYGLTGAGPWPVLLPGYLLHALRLPRASLPYSPTAADAEFT